MAESIFPCIVSSTWSSDDGYTLTKNCQEESQLYGNFQAESYGDDLVHREAVQLQQEANVLGQRKTPDQKCSLTFE